MEMLKHVSAVRTILSSGPASDDFRFSDSLIAHFLSVSRAKILEMKIDKYNFISEQSYQDWCVNLEPSTFHDCCVEADLGCLILRSTVKIPKFLNSRWGNFAKITDLVGNTIPEFNLTQNKYSDYGLVKVKVGWFVHNNYLYIINNKELIKVIMNALFDDPLAVEAMNCSSTEADCPDYLSTDFPLDPDLVDGVYQLTIERLLTRSPQDIENDAADNQVQQN